MSTEIISANGPVAIDGLPAERRRWAAAAIFTALAMASLDTAIDAEIGSLTPEREVLENCACHKVRIAARAVTRAYDEALRPVGLRAPSHARRRSRFGAGEQAAPVSMRASRSSAAAHAHHP